MHKYALIILRVYLYFHVSTVVLRQEYLVHKDLPTFPREHTCLQEIVNKPTAVSLVNVLLGKCHSAPFQPNVLLRIGESSFVQSLAVGHCLTVLYYSPGLLPLS